MPRRDESFGMGALKTGAVVSAVAGAYKFGEFVIKLRHLRGIDGENSVYARILERVTLDLLEVERLLELKEVKDALRNSPAKVEWIQTCVGDMREALEDTDKIIKGVSAGLGSWTWGLWSRAKWALHDHETLQHRRMEVAVKHLSILNVITYLSPLEPMACCDPKTKFDQRKKVYDEAREFYRDIDERGRDEGRYETEKDRYYIKDFDVYREPEPERYEKRREDIVEVDQRGRGYGDEYVVENGKYYRNVEQEEPPRYPQYEERDRVVRVEEDVCRPGGEERYREERYREREYEEDEPRRIEMVDYESREVEVEEEEEPSRHRHKHHRRVAHHHRGGSTETEERFSEVEVDTERGAWVRRRGSRL